MNELAILQQLGLSLFISREKKEETAAPVTAIHHPFVICLNETQVEFSHEHQTQLEKITAFLGYGPQEYHLVFKDQSFQGSCDISLVFGEGCERGAKHFIKTHSITMMLQNPACKREVLNAIQSLKRAN